MFLNIQWLRALGACMVLLYHLAPHYQAMGGPGGWAVGAMAFAFSGVDVFFVVSGFVMMHVIHGKPPVAANLREFLGRRFVRIYGWYLPCAALMLWLSWVYEPAAFERVKLLRSAFLASVHLPDLALPVSWSLSYELYFYALIALAWKLAPRHLPAVLWTVGAGLVVLYSFVRIPDGARWSFVTTPFMLEFIAGALLYRYRPLFARHLAMAGCAAAAVFFCWLGVRFNATNNFVRSATFGVAALSLVALLVGLEQQRLYVAGRLGKALGDASYTIYLLHLPFILVFFQWGLRDALQRAGGAFAAAGFFALLALFLALCVAVHRFIELPLYRGLCGALGLAHAAPPAPVGNVPVTASV